MLLRHSRQTCALSFWSRIYIAAALLREQKVSQAPRTDTGCCAFRAVASRQDRKLVRHSGQRLAALPPSVSLPLVSLQNRKLVRHTGQRLAAVVSRSSIPPGQKVSQALRPETRCSLSLSLSHRHPLASLQDRKLVRRSGQGLRDRKKPSAQACKL